MSATTVIHVRDMVDGDVYIGRAVPRKGLAASIWGNPFSLRTMTREQAIAAYRTYLLGRANLLVRVPDLRGKRLACFCAPKPCHGDVLAELAEAVT